MLIKQQFPCGAPLGQKDKTLILNVAFNAYFCTQFLEIYYYTKVILGSGHITLNAKLVLEGTKTQVVSLLRVPFSQLSPDSMSFS